MPSPTENIRAGLDKNQAKSGKPVSSLTVTPRLADIVGIRGDLPSLKKLKSAVITNHSNVLAIRDAVAAAFKEQEPKIRHANRHYGMSPGDKEGHWYDDLGEVKRNEHITRLINAMKKDVVAINATSVNEHMQVIQKAQATISDMKSLWEDSVSVLMRRTLFSERRASLIANLAHAGPKELIDAMETALRHNDRDLAAACCVRLDAMTKSARDQVEEHCTKRDLAEALMQEDLKTARAYILLAEAHAAEAELAAREALNMRVNPTDRIGLGERKAAIERELGVSLEELLKEDDKITPDPAPVVKVEDTVSPEMKKVMEKEAAWKEWTAAYDAGEYDKAEAIARKHDFDIYDDEDAA